MAQKDGCSVTLYVCEEDGSVRVSATCFSEAQVLSIASKYERVKVYQKGVYLYWLKCKKELVESLAQKDEQADDGMSSDNLAWQQEDLSGVYVSPHANRPKLPSYFVYDGSGSRRKPGF